MAEAMTGRDYFIQHGYDELPEAVREEMRRVFYTGVNNSGVWVRFKEVENLAGIMAYEYVHRHVTTNADRIRAMTDEELADKLWSISHYLQGKKKISEWLDWLQQEAET